MPDPEAPTGYAAFWHLVHEGGITIRTFADPPANSQLALSTLVQIDGDRTTQVNFGAMKGLTSEQRRGLAEEHGQQTRACLAGVRGRIDRWLGFAHTGLLTLFGAGEAVSLGRGFMHGQWAGVLTDQRWCLAPLAVRLLSPVAMRVVRYFQSAALTKARRAVSAEVHAKMVRGEAILRPHDPA